MSSLRHPRARFLLVVALVAMTPGCGGSGAGAALDTGEIEALERQMWEDWKNRNLEAMRGRVTADALVFGGDAMTDRDAAFAAMAKETCEVESVSLDSVKVTTLAPSVALISYRANAVGTCNGQPLAPANHSSIWVQSDGQWRTVHHQASPSQANLIAGNWELNLSKSKFVPAGDAPRSQARVYQVVGQQETGRHTGVNAQGNPSVIEFTAAYDGKDYPYKGSPDTDTVALTRVDANTTAFTQSREGKVVLTGTRVVSPDGKTLTITAKGTNAKGQRVDNVIVYDRR